LPKAGKGAGVDQSWNRTLLVLSWLWLAIVTAYSIWGAVTYSGLYRLVAELQIDQWGGYSEKWTAILPGMLLAAPAFWYLRRRAAIAAAAGPRLGGEAGQARRMAMILGVIGLVSALVGMGAFLISQTLPDGSEAAVPFDAARLGSAPAPTGRVAIRGEADPAVTTGVTESGRLAMGAAIYAGFRPDGEAKGAPIRLFVERAFGDRADAATDQFFLPEQTGYLVENGLPGLALHDLEARGIQVARPNYVLRTARLARRDIYYVVAGLGGFFALLLLGIAGAALLRARLVAARS
jgi:hypothetical protein